MSTLNHKVMIINWSVCQLYHASSFTHESNARYW